MQAIIDSLPEHVLNLKDHVGKTIIDDGFFPFLGVDTIKVATELKGNDFLQIIRPQYIMEEVECNGKKLQAIKEKIEGNIQEAIDHKVKYISIEDDDAYPCNSFEDDVYKLLDAGHIQVMVIDGELKSNGKQYHVDFMFNEEIGDNITSYFNFGRETAKTVVLKCPKGPITNNLISLGYGGDIPTVYPDTITSKFICHTNYTNARKNQDILDMIAVLKAKIEALYFFDIIP